MWFTLRVHYRRTSGELRCSEGQAVVGELSESNVVSPRLSPVVGMRLLCRHNFGNNR